MDPQTEQQWFALRVKARHEKAVASAARGKGFEEFVPLSRDRRRWSDRYKLVDQPLFPGYIFCRLRVQDRFALLTIPGVMHLVGVAGLPEAFADEEIQAIRTALLAGTSVKPWPFLEAGERVRLESGPLAGTEGLLVRDDQQHQIVLGLDALKQSVAIEIEPGWLMPASRSAAQSPV